MAPGMAGQFRAALDRLGDSAHLCIDYEEQRERLATTIPFILMLAWIKDSADAAVHAGFRALRMVGDMKSADLRELELAVRAVARGDTWLSGGVSKALVDALARGERPRQGPLDVPALVRCAIRLGIVRPES